MPNNPRFPPSAEIKRVLAAAIKAGIKIGSIEIHRGKIVIYGKRNNSPEITAYDMWKMEEGADTERIRRTEENTDAMPRKPKG